MRKTIWALALFALMSVIGIGACDILDPSPEATITEPDTSADECDNLKALNVGSVIYRCQCASCHGADGMPVADDVTDIRGYVSLTDFEVALSSGPSSMPAFPGLNDAQRALLFEYVKDSLGS